MKKKKWLLPVSMIGGFILLCILLLIVTVCIIGIKGYGISKGRLYLAEKHTYLIDDRDMAMLVSDQSKKGNLFQGYGNGDEVLIVHDGVEETYPSRTGAYYVILTAKGDGTYEPTDEVLGLHNILTKHRLFPIRLADIVETHRPLFISRMATVIHLCMGILLH